MRKTFLWRVTVADEILNPKLMRNLTVQLDKPSASLAIVEAQQVEGFVTFHKQYPKCVVVKIEFIGLLENSIKVPNLTVVEPAAN